MPELDAIIEAAAVYGELAGGANLAVVTARNGRAAVVLRGARHQHRTRRHWNMPWLPEEDAFLRENLGRLSEAEIGRRLGRTVTAVRIRWKNRLHLAAPSKDPRILTAEQIANGLGMDGKSVHRLIDRGLLPGRRLPWANGRICRIVERRTLLHWLANPEHWCYFRPERVGTRWSRQRRYNTGTYDQAFWDRARQLVELRRRQWADAWLTPGQVGRLHGITDRHDADHFVNKAIRGGRLKATRWGNWWIKRSDAMAPDLVLRRFVGRGGKGYERYPLGPRADAFLVMARAVGHPFSAIDRLMKRPRGADFRLQQLRRRIPGLIRDHKLPVQYCTRTERLFSDWRRQQRRFPALARAMRRLMANGPMSKSDRLLAFSVLRNWCAWHAHTKEQKRAALKLRTFGGRRSAADLRRRRQQMKAWGFDPCRYVRLEK